MVESSLLKQRDKLDFQQIDIYKVEEKNKICRFSVLILNMSALKMTLPAWYLNRQIKISTTNLKDKSLRCTTVFNLIQSLSKY